MNQLLEKNQEISIVPKDFKNSNKGKVIEVQDRAFLVETFLEPEGIVPQKIMEFYSPTEHGVLYFVSNATEINGNILTISTPKKHRFLPRRVFTRIHFTQEMELHLNNEKLNVNALDLSAGGMKIKTTTKVDIDSSYDLSLKLLEDQPITCEYEPLKIEKSDKGEYTVSGRFKNLSNTDRMKIIQFCMSKNTEKVNK